MDAYTKGLQAISNNVANLDTPGYKEVTTSFSDLFNDNSGELGFSGGPNGQNTGYGVELGPTQIDFSQGTLQQTNGGLDLGIQGAGFLVLLNGSQTLYTRTGSFAVDSSGFITEQGTKYRLGVLNASGQAQSVNISSDESNPPVATTNVTFSDNLSSSATTDTVSNITVYDSSGVQHTWQVALAASTSTPGTWNVTVTDETGATVGTGAISFNGSTISSSNDTLTINTTPTGANPLSVVLDFSGVTSFSSGTTSTLQVASSNGNALGSLASITVNSSGQLTLTYSNNQTLQLGAVAVANFIDPQALTPVSGNVFANNSNASVQIGASGTNGLGTLQPQEIEASNVNLTQEFGDLILIQRGFQASSQVVSVANDMIQQLFGIRGQG
jgi:flagellar hook protein FlgE